jgi:hypothetical protein
VAAAQGVHPDMPLAEAKSLVRRLAVERHDPAADCQALMKLAEACERFSPCVALEEGDEPESLLLDIYNLRHLLGSDAELAAKVEQFFTERRYRVQIAVADTMGLAWAVAHYGEFRIADCRLRIEDDKSAICNPKSEMISLDHLVPLGRPTRIGSVNQKVEPFPGLDSTQMRPPCISTIRLAMESPRPVPPFFRVLELSTCWNSSKIFA